MMQLSEMTVEQFWDQAGGMGGAPSYDFEQIGDTVEGKVVKQVVRQRTKMGDPNTKLFNKDGSPQMQLEVTLSTALRGWDKVKTKPTVDVNGQTLIKNPAEDNGDRRIYVWFKLRDAVSEAVAASGAQPARLLDGGILGVRFVSTEPNPQGNQPIKVYKARYSAPAASDGFLAPQDHAPAQQAPQQPQYAPQQAAQQPQYAPPQYAPQQPAPVAYAPPTMPPAAGYAVAPQQPAYAPPQGVPQGYAQNPQVQQAQAPGVAAPASPYAGEPPF